jgi:hypothetical protein
MERLFLSFLEIPMSNPLPKPAARLLGVNIVPHNSAPDMRYREQRGPGPAAKVTLFVEGPALPKTFNGKTPAELLASGDWAWHDTATAVQGVPGSLTVWTFNGKSDAWGVGRTVVVEGDGIGKVEVPIVDPNRWISAVTFRSRKGTPFPDRVVVHVANANRRGFRITGVRLWLPKSGKEWQTLFPGKVIPVKGEVSGLDSGCVVADVGELPLTYAAVEVQTTVGPLWAHLRIKAESFDISGGWINNEGSRAHTEPAFLGLLASLHVDTAHYQEMPGYSDNDTLRKRYPLKRFNKLDPIERYDSDSLLPSIHAVEFLGEPQYGGGRPVPPQEVFDSLLPYRTSRLPTSVTHSEERIWRWYAGLSDYPHYDAYRVTAPSADEWTLYERWGGRKIRWGAPLETIGSMCRSMRDLNRPVPCAYWSQGPHEGWDDPFDGRKRRSPNPAELRSQAIHALATRITALYWFNLSLNSLMLFPDTWDAMRRVGREIRMLSEIYLDGDATWFKRVAGVGNGPGWELSTVAAPDAAVCFAVDTAYRIATDKPEFEFGPPRDSVFDFELPARLRKPADVFRVDADGVHGVSWKLTPTGVQITDKRSEDGIYVVAKAKQTRDDIVRRHGDAVAHEQRNSVELSRLQAVWKAEQDAKPKRR